MNWIPKLIFPPFKLFLSGIATMIKKKIYWYMALEKYMYGTSTLLVEI